MTQANNTNYLISLTTKEKENLCDFIPGEVFKNYFVQYPQDFQKLKKGGFRAKALTESQAASIAKSGVNSPFIAYLLNRAVQKWLDDIQANREGLESQGLQPDKALAMTLADSFFYDDVDLYFKLIKKDVDRESRQVLIEDIELVQFIREDSESYYEFKRRQEELLEEKDHREVEKNQNEKNKKERKQEQKTKAEQEKKYKQKIKELEKETENLKDQLSKKTEEIKTLRTPPKTILNKDIDSLQQYDDTNDYLLSKIDQNTEGTKEISSLCSICHDENENIWLYRHADIDAKGELHQFNQSPEFPPLFENRTRIYYMNGPSDDSYYGIWSWTAQQNYNDPTKDYIESDYREEFEATEVIIVPKVKKLDDLIASLRKGIQLENHSDRILFAYPTSKNSFTGILSTQKDRKMANGKAFLLDECLEIPVYEFSRDQLLTTKDGLTFYNHVFLGIPKSLYPLKSPLEIVQKVITNSISWSFYKERGKYHSQYTSFREMLGLVPTDTITEKIMTLCRCSRPAAQELLNEFISNASKFIDGESLNDSILLSLVSTNAKLQEQIKSLIYQDWELENHTLIEEKQKDISDVEKKLAKVAKDLESVKEDLQKAQEEENKILLEIADKEKLAKDVETAVSERIQDAREHAADFIANMAFLQSSPIKSQPEEELEIQNPLKTQAQEAYKIVSIQEEEELEPYNTWIDVIEILEAELQEAGVKEKYRNGLATYLCAAFILKEPVILIGPNAMAMIEAIAVTLSNHKYGLLNCDQEFHMKAIERFGEEKEQVIVLNNLLLSGWVSRLPEILCNKEFFFIAHHPFSEDIKVEPKSLYGFILPLFTEFFVDEIPSENYIGGFFSDRFDSTLTASEVKGKVDLSFLASTKTSLLVHSKIRNLIKLMRLLNPSIKSEEEFFFAILPIAYATLLDDELQELLSNTSVSRIISEETRRDLQTILGEF